MPDLSAIISAAIAPASAAAAAAETAAAPEPVAAAESVAEPVEGAEPVAEESDQAATPVEEPIAQDGVTSPVVPIVSIAEPVDDFAVEHGIKAKDSAGRENRIPYSAVKRINANAVKKATEALAVTHTTALSEHIAKITDYEDRLAKVAEVEHMMFEDQARFVSILKTLPGYTELLGPQVSAAQPLSEKAPGPDLETGYSPEGLQALLDWHTERATIKASKEAEDRISKRYGPIEDRYKKDEANAKFDATERPKVEARIQDARDNWVGYKENEAEIQQAFLTNKSFTLDAAWRSVVAPKLVADRTKMRAELLAEMAAAPTGTSISPVAATSPAARAVSDPNKPMDLAETIRHSIAGLKR